MPTMLGQIPEGVLQEVKKSKNNLFLLSTGRPRKKITFYFFLDNFEHNDVDPVIPLVTLDPFGAFYPFRHFDPLRHFLTFGPFWTPEQIDK